MGFEFEPIGTIHTPYPEKFSVPRQPGLVNADRSRILLTGKCNREEIVRGIEGFSHLWLLWVFDQALREDWKPTVRPPRLGGNLKLGVFATRSPFRPNPIGLSVVMLRGVGQQDGAWFMDVSGVDIVNGSPILDIKPYLPYSDSIDHARAAYAEQAPATIPVQLSDAAKATVNANRTRYPELEPLLVQVLAQQSQPAYHRDQERLYGTLLLNFNVLWRLANDICRVEVIETLKT